MRRILRGTAWLGLALIVVAANLVAGGYFYLRSDHARNHLVSWGLAQLAPILSGGIRLGRSEGDLTEHLVLYDLVLEDLDGAAAISADRIELRYSLVALIVGRVQIDFLGASGLTIVSRTLADGRNNLATLARIKAPAVAPISIVLGELDLSLRFVRLPPHTPLERAPHDTDVRAQIHGRADLDRLLALHVDELRIEIAQPIRGTIDLRGSVGLGARMALHQVRLRIDTDAHALRSHVDSSQLHGPIVLVAEADGPLTDLKASVRLRAGPALRLLARAHLSSTRLEIAELSLTAPFARIRGSGIYAFDRTGEATVHASVASLAALSALGVPPMTGRIELDANAHRDSHETVIKLDGLIDDFSFQGTRVRHAGLHVDTVDLTGHARLAATGVRRGELALSKVDVEADGSDRDLRLAAHATGPEGIELALGLTGVPRLIAGRLHGIEGTLQELSLRAGGSPWRVERPAHLSADFDLSMYALGRLQLVNDPQRISIEGRVMGGAIEDVFVDVKHFDLSELPAALSPGHVMPHTDVSAELEAHGSFDDPDVSTKFTAELFGRGEADLIHATGTGDARLTHGRLGGKLFVTIGGQKASLKVDMPLPLRPAQPIDVSFDASVLLSPTFADLLVPKLIQSQPLVMYALGAKVTAQGHLTGTTSDPKLNASARVARWAVAGAHGDVGLSVEYGARDLGASLTLTLSSLPGGGGAGGGIIEATAKLRADLSAVLTGGEGRLLGGDAPIHADVTLRHVGLDHVPFAAFHFISPVQHGWIDGKAELAGTTNRPKVTAQLSATGLVAAGITDIDLHGSGDLQGSAVTGDLRLAVHGSEAFRLHGSLDGGHDRRPRFTDLVSGALAVRLDVNDFDLARLGIVRGLDGLLRGKAELTGSLSRPTGAADFKIVAMRVGDTKFRAFHVSAHAADAIATGEVRAEQDTGARFLLEGRIPFSGAPLDAHLLANRFALDFGSETLPGIRLLRGLLDADVRLSGDFHAPKLLGKLALGRGELRISATAMSYRDIDAELELSGEKITVTALRLASGTSGQANGTGSVLLARLSPAKVAGQLTLRHFPIQQAGVAMLLDAEVDISGQRSAAGVLEGKIALSHAGAQLADPDAKGGLLPTATLEDVSVVRPPLERGRGDKQTAKPAAMTPGPRVSATLDGPFVIRGGDVSATARGALLVDLSGARPALRGSIAIDPQGWVQLFGHRYDLADARVFFDGEADPKLELQLSRSYAQSLIGVDVSGPATKPSLVFWSKPPIYDPTQVVSIILSGNPSINGVSTKGLERKRYGTMSELVVTGIRKNFLSALPISVFRSDADQTRGANPQGSQIELGKYLTESLYVGYAYQIGADRVGIRRANRNEARMEYLIAPKLQLEAKGGDAGVGGVDLFWSWRP